MKIAAFLDRLSKVRRSGRGWMACCPGHDDRKQSLSICEGDDGGILITCFAGCGRLSVIQAMGLEWIDLAPACRQDDYERQRRKRGPEYVPWRDVISHLREDLEVVQISAAEIALDIPMTIDDLRRAWKAAERVKQVLNRVNA